MLGLNIKVKATYVSPRKVVIEMTPKQLESLGAVFDSFCDQVTASNPVYGDCVRNINALDKAIKIANQKLVPPKGQ